MSNKTAYLGRHHSLALMVSTALLSQGVITNAYAIDCQGVAPWSADAIYASTAQVTQTNTLYQNKWWTTNESPTDSGDFGVWETVGACGGVANYPPVVTIESPLDMNTVNLGDLVVLSAQASDADGRVESLVWTINDTVITSPWTAEQQGLMNITATATDDVGESTSDVVNITVLNSQNLPPVTAILSPINDSVVSVGKLVSVKASASDPDSGDSVTKVELTVDGVLVSSDTTAPYGFNWSAITAGLYSLQTRAFDTQNDSAVSSVINIQVNEANELPTVSISRPLANFEAALNGELSIVAAASDSDGQIDSVAFYANGVLISEDLSAPYSAVYNLTEQGSLSITARATDDTGGVGVSSVVYGYVGDKPVTHEACRPDGLEGDSLYCDIYDEDGREKMGADHARRVIGYFTSWRNGANGQPSYLVNDIPWDKITHINYAFAHIDSGHRVSVGNVNSIDNPATGMSWEGVAGAEMDPEYTYKGHFNLLNKYKKLHPQVKTFISIGGWAETGGYFDDNGVRVASGGFYEMTKTQAGINSFADSVVEFLRLYGFDGADIDYEYATSMAKSGNPDDFAISDPLRASLFKQYDQLMKTLRTKLDAASQKDGKHYMLTVAAPASGYLLRGMEAHQMTRFLDYVNIMSYDLHGAWNDFVGHNSALFDNGDDAELAFWDVYSTAEYGGIGYLNTDWAYHYFRGAMPAGRINIGLPYYTRGWQGVTGGTNGLWGKAALPDQASCPTGTGEGDNNCGYGAQGIDNIWHDLDKEGNEMFAGSNPMWHAKNLEQGIAGSYLGSYGLDPQNNPADKLTGRYERHFDNGAKSSWLWNQTKQVYLSTEDEQAMTTKVQYVVDKGLGGVMFWELAGDFDWYPERNAGQGEYFIGETMTTIAYDKFTTAAPYGNRVSNSPALANTLALSANLSGYKVGDSNYPITPTLTITNNSQSTIPGGAVFEFDISTSTSSQISDQSGMNLTVIADGSNAASGNVGGLENDFHRVRFTLPSYKSIAAGADFGGTIKYYLPVSMPSNFTVTFDGVTYDFGQSGDRVPDECELDPIAPGCGDTTPPTSDSCSDANVDPSVVPAYPNFPQTDWGGDPSHALGGDKMKDEAAVFVALWWTNAKPSVSSTDWSFVCNIN